MAQQRPNWLYALLIVLGVGLALSQMLVDPCYEKIRKAGESADSGDRGSLMVQLPAQFLVASMTGFKEVIAGTLWVRADEFFHTGQYQAIMPIVRIVTWLDPHNTDVYTTGAWHLDYNFVDDEQRSDKRYIPAAIALLQEGIRNNPDNWDLYFELGWTHFNKKIEDFEKALEYMQKACQYEGSDPNTGKKIPRPEYVDRMVAHQLEKLGRLDEAVKQWKYAKQRVWDQIPKGKPIDLLNDSELTLCDRNLGLLYLRMAFRYGDMNAYKNAVDIYRKLAEKKGATADVLDTYKAIAPDYARRVAQHDPPHDALKPLDAKFDVSWKKLSPKVFLFSGKVNIIPASEYKDLACEIITHWYRDNQKRNAASQQGWRDGSRVYWMLTDADYKAPVLSSFNWKIDTTKTVVWDSAYVGGGSFSVMVDLSKNAEFYPFAAKKYKLTIWMRPQSPGVPDFVQDRIGWKGEALTDKRYLVTTPQPDLRINEPGFRMLKKEVILDRSDIM
jgi:tetratricopeptide (TPR) repeat protein